MTRLIVIGPLPPPYHGVTVSTSLVLANRDLGSRFAVEHLDTSDHRSGASVGRWDVGNVVAAVKAVTQFARLSRGEPGIVYLPISQGLAGLLRDGLFIRLAARRGWKVTAHLRGSELADVYRRQPAPIRWWLRPTFRRLDSVAVLGQSLRGAVQGLVPPERVAVVANGTVDPGLNGRHADPRTGLYLANLSRRKGPVEAMTAALQVVREEPGARFVFAGELRDPVVMGELKGLVAQAGGRIELSPAVTGDEKAELLATSAFLLFPPREPEGQPRVVLEAMAAGLPLVTTDRGAIAETVADGVAGFVLPDPDPSQLADRMLRLLRDPELRTAMSDRSRARYLELFTQDAADKALADWLADVAAAR